jgi:stage II sporulation protein AA (anti-sigma F factor antagonist)
VGIGLRLDVGMSVSSAEASVAVTSAPSVTTIAIRGELDLYSQSSFAAAIDRVWSQPRPPRVLRMDLSGLSFMDTSGLGLLLTAHRRALELGCEMRVGPLSPPIERLFRVTGVAAIFGDARPPRRALG